MEHPHYDVATFVGEKSNLKKFINLDFTHDKHFFLSLDKEYLKEKN